MVTLKEIALEMSVDPSSRVLFYLTLREKEEGKRGLFAG